MKLFYFLLFYVKTSQFFIVAESCTTLGQPCDQTCDCCDHDVDPRIRCEERNEHVGRRCFTGKFCGEPCANDHECYSQQCRYPSLVRRRLDNGTTQKSCYCNTSGQGCPCVASLKKGQFSNEDGYNPSLGKDAANAIDDKPETHFEHSDETKCAVELQTVDSEEIHVCAIYIDTHSEKAQRPVKVYLEGWCTKENTWIAIALKTNILKYKKNKILVINPFSSGPYSKFRVSFHRKGDRTGINQIKVSEIKLFHKCHKKGSCNCKKK